MTRPQHSMYMQHSNHNNPQRLNAPYGPNMGQRTPNVQVGPEGMPMGAQEWRHLVMTQQQSMNFNSGVMRPNFNPNHQGEFVSLSQLNFQFNYNVSTDF